MLTNDGPVPIGGARHSLQTCLVHVIRNSLDLAGWQDRKALAAALRTLSTASSTELALAALEAFAAGPWGRRSPTIATASRRAWPDVIPFFAFPPARRRRAHLRALVPPYFSDAPVLQR